MIKATVPIGFVVLQGPAVDGKQKSGSSKPVEGKVVYPIVCRLWNTSQVVGLGISGCHHKWGKHNL